MRTKRESIKRLRSLNREQLHELSENLELSEEQRFNPNIVGSIVASTFLILTVIIIIW